MVNAIIAPDTMPGAISWSVTLKNACRGVQPKSMAASRRELSVCLSFGMTFRIT